jgi:alcohol dehydrogenase
MYKIQLNSNVLFGRGALSALPHRLVEMSVRKPGVVVDSAVRHQTAFSELLAVLTAAGIQPAVEYDCDARREPTYAYLDEVAGRYRSADIDVLIGVGGGSALDLTKGVAVLKTNPGLGLEYKGVDKLSVPGIPTILIPTTAGTGSEATGTASFIDEGDGVKLGINGRHVACALAVLDPIFTRECPRNVTIAAGLDALVHAVEAITTRSTTPLARLLGAEAVRLMFNGLAGSVLNPDDLHARADALLGSHYAGLAMWNASGGPSSGVSYPLGVHWRVPHGWAGGLLLPHVVALNIRNGYYEGYALLDRALGGDHGRGPDPARAFAFHARLNELYRGINAPPTFKGFGVSKADGPRLAALTLSQKRINLELNPIEFGEPQLAELLDRVLD